MKLLKTIAAIVMISLIPMAYSGCDDTADESCEQQDMNEILTCGGEKNVEVCCTSGSDCVYKYNGQDYPDTETGLNNLADALGCTYKTSEDNLEEVEMIITHLIALREKAKAGLY